MSNDGARLLPESPVGTLVDYLAAGGGKGLLLATEAPPETLLRTVEDSGLKGRGGAGFPTGTKWRSIVDSAHEDGLAISVVVNAAEGEPGTYKDRALLELNPYLVVEGALIAATAVGARDVHFGVKDSAGRARERLEHAVDEAAAAGWPRSEVIEIVRGPDEYLFGEEKALLEVIEGKLPMPRHLAPFANGLFTSSAHPSVALVNNVETLANVPSIVTDGPDAFRSVGTQSTPGTLLFTVVGDVEAHGVYELPAGTQLGTLLVDLAGAHDMAFAYPGTSAGVITPEMFDVPLDHDDMAAAGTALGSGGYVVYDTRHCVVRVAAELLRFLSVESCGQCNACQLGTTELHEVLGRIDAGEGSELDLQQLARWTERVTDLARCGLPSGAQLIVASLLERFHDDVTGHLDRSCPSDVDELVPKIEHLDLETGATTFDERHRSKLSDWSYTSD